MSRTRPLETTPLSIVRALISSSMASVPLILQHNWTGVLAIYATAPAQPLLANPVKGVSNSRARGAWLKATSHARLRMHESQDAGCCIELYLQEHVLLRCPLHKQLLSMNLLPSSSTGSSNILLITPNQQSKVRCRTVVCSSTTAQVTTASTVLQTMLSVCALLAHMETQLCSCGVQHSPKLMSCRNAQLHLYATAFASSMTLTAPASSQL